MTPHEVLNQAQAHGMSYANYRQLIDSLLQQGKTTGPDQSEKMLGYARLNQQRMQRIEKQLSVLPELLDAVSKTNVEQTWVVLTEGWCGDAAQNLPLIARVAEASPYITFRVLLRDEHPAVMDQYLYNGTRSIPRVILFKQGLEVAVWGPRPAPAQEIVDEGKRTQRPHDEWSKELHAWYGRDKTQTLQREWANLIRNVNG